jgi:hypothetical protein
VTFGNPDDLPASPRSPSPTHCGAVCKEIGERLSLALGPQSSELSPALLALIEQLAKRESYNSNQNFTGLNE